MLPRPTQHRFRSSLPRAVAVTKRPLRHGGRTACRAQDPYHVVGSRMRPKGRSADLSLKARQLPSIPIRGRTSSVATSVIGPSKWRSPPSICKHVLPPTTVGREHTPPPFGTTSGREPSGPRRSGALWWRRPWLTRAIASSSVVGDGPDKAVSCGIAHCAVPGSRTNRRSGRTASCRLASCGSLWMKATAGTPTARVPGCQTGLVRRAAPAFHTA
jgi:hypothetical protein